MNIIITINKSEVGGPSGQHNNDFIDIRKIIILPTPDELILIDLFLRRLAEIPKNETGLYNLALHIDSQFRLLREDILRDLQEEI